jgi:hypothetical protein
VAKTKAQAIDYVIKNCYNGITPEQVAEVLDLLEQFGMKPPLSHAQGVIEQGVSFKVPIYEWEE